MATASKSKRHPIKVRVPRLGVVRAPASDLDVANMRLQGKPFPARLKQAVSDGSIETTISGASTLTLTVADWAHGLLRSQLLTGACTLTFDNVPYSLVKITTTDRYTVQLTFEERAVNLLRQYDSPKTANRDSTTRAQFVRSMVKEVKEAVIPFACPEVNAAQPVAASASPAGVSWQR